MELFSLEEKVAYLPKTSPALDHIPKVECTLVNILVEAERVFPDLVHVAHIFKWVLNNILTCR
jgi:hypothetical protein